MKQARFYDPSDFTFTKDEEQPARRIGMTINIIVIIVAGTLMALKSNSGEANKADSSDTVVNNASEWVKPPEDIDNTECNKLFN
jgi:hypothetical protein